MDTSLFSPVLAEGKTKRILRIPNEPDMCAVCQKDDITAGDGAKHDVLEGKAQWATETTCNVFRLLRRRNLPLAYLQRLDATTFKAKLCTMLPFEVVVRREAHGSYLKRHPDVERGKEFDQLITEVYLKTSGRRWLDYELPVDDPLLVYDQENNVAQLYDPKMPTESQEYFLCIPMSEIVGARDYPALLVQMIYIATSAFIILEEAWLHVGGKLVDFKVEFGLDSQGELLLADEINNDSWRVIFHNEYIDKQRYRDGKSLSDVSEFYRLVAEMTGKFAA